MSTKEKVPFKRKIELYDLNHSWPWFVPNWLMKRLRIRAWGSPTCVQGGKYVKRSE